MPRQTPITDFLFRLEVDSDFVNRVFGPSFSTEPPSDLDVERRDAAFEEYGLPPAARTAIVEKDFATLQRLVDLEHPDPVHILPRGWVA
jgi:hypothetical protein